MPDLSDEELTTDEREGFVSFEIGECSWRLARREREQAMSAWLAYRRGERTDPIYSGVSVLGASMEIDLSKVDGVIDFAPEVLARGRADDMIRRQRETLHGDG